MYFIRRQPALNFPSAHHTTVPLWYERPHFVLYQPDWNLTNIQQHGAATAASASDDVMKDRSEGDDEQTRTIKRERKSQEKRVLYDGKSIQVTEDQNKFELILDVPGVKKEHVTVNYHDGVLHVTAERKVGDQVVASYSQHFSLEESMVDSSNITATLIHGVLTISAPKKTHDEHSEEEMAVVVKAGTAPKKTGTEQDQDRFEITVDVPGIKLDAFTIKYKEGTLDIQGERKRGSTSVKFQRQFMVDTNKVNVSSFEGFLEDGVLTIVAPKKEILPARDIVVQDGSESLSIEAAKAHVNGTNDDVIVVETATED